MQPTKKSFVVGPTTPERSKSGGSRLPPLRTRRGSSSKRGRKRESPATMLQPTASGAGVARERPLVDTASPSGEGDGCTARRQYCKILEFDPDSVIEELTRRELEEGQSFAQASSSMHMILTVVCACVLGLILIMSDLEERTVFYDRLDLAFESGLLVRRIEIHLAIDRERTLACSIELLHFDDHESG